MSGFFDVEPDWKEHWRGMPSFEVDDQSPFQSIIVHFRGPADRKAFSELIERNVTPRTRSIWYPREEIGRMSDRRFRSEEVLNPRYPIYVISKGRWESRLTVKSLELIGTPYRVVVEPQERERYAAVIDPAKILTLPFSNLGKGSRPARNWVWEHAVSEGALWHWILDDNIGQNFEGGRAAGTIGFYRLYRNIKTPVTCGNVFRAAEDFVGRYENVALAGFNYFMFVSRKTLLPPYYLNTRVYSCILIRNDVYPKGRRWRGRYNEDTDLSLRVLKDGWCTVLFNAFLCFKRPTLTMGGGNTDELYAGEGRLEMAKSLERQHPDCVKVVRKFGRWQHSVDYRRFKRNRLKPKGDLGNFPETCEYGMYLERDKECL